MSASEEQTKFNSYQSRPTSGPLSWMLRSLSSHSFKTLDQKDFAEYIWRSGEKKRKEPWETAMQWEEHLVCHSNGPEEDLWATVSVTSWMTFSWVLGLFLTSCYFPAYFVPFQIISFLCLLRGCWATQASFDCCLYWYSLGNFYSIQCWVGGLSFLK